MLRQAQHERKLLNHFRYPPFVLSDVEGLLKEFFNKLSTFETLALFKSVKEFEPRGGASQNPLVATRTKR